MAFGRGARPAGADVVAGPGERDAESRRRRQPSTPLQRAIGLLSRREHSRKELVAKLQARGVEPADAVAAVDQLAERGWQDNGRFAESLARMRVSHGYGPLRIRAELATHDIRDAQAGEAVDAAVDADRVEWPLLARSLVAKRYGSAAELAADHGLRRKATDFLIRRGFDGDAVRAAMRPAG